ncbi:MAG: Ni/Fe hydrogenase subunit alpha [Candidatus Marinimicrobia bacterium]|nr:Ni/Fe hydrogenase subunit alpha [Candidatus Neomarinimicrobiota bacterium]
MLKDLNIKVHHLTRVEGHGNIVVDMKKGVLEKAQLEIVEPPRYFEAFLKGRNYHEAALITSRICGICSLGHQLTSLKATEAALGLEVSEQTILLRKLLIDGATFQSNILHALFLVTPDLLDLPSVFPLVNSNKAIVEAALRLKRLANKIGTVVSGRAIHPIRCVPGGFSKLPTETELKGLKNELKGQGTDDLNFILEILMSLKENIPSFERDTEYISYYSDKEYGFYDGVIKSSDTGLLDENDYESIANEFVVTHSTSKHAKHHRSSYMVGALARYNNSHQFLSKTAKAVAEKLGLTPGCTNPYMNTIAQIVETAHCIDHSIELIDILTEKEIQPEAPNQKITRYGRGIGVTEVPRGILFHDYKYNRQGLIEKANCIIPTGQNLANIDDDMKKLVPELMNESKEQITKKLEMLVRAYDPCISCSVHMIKVKFRE